MKQFIYSLLLVKMIAIIATGCNSQKQTAAQNSKVAGMVDDKTYTFVARSVFPTEDSRFNVRNLFPNAPNLYQLTSYYDVKITPDSVIAYLPFFGRAYTAPMDPTKGGIQFTSTNFSYKTTMRKKNYEIEIIPKDNNDIRSLYFTISSSGFSSLRINSINKTPISYNGEVVANRK